VHSAEGIINEMLISMLLKLLKRKLNVTIERIRSDIPQFCR
jgi:hypothetical protein